MRLSVAGDTVLASPNVDRVFTGVDTQSTLQIAKFL